MGISQNSLHYGKVEKIQDYKKNSALLHSIFLAFPLTDHFWVDGPKSPYPDKAGLSCSTLHFCFTCLFHA